MSSVTISYPVESLSVEWHILMMIIATIVTVIGLYLGYLWRPTGNVIENIIETTETESPGTTVKTTRKPFQNSWEDILKGVIPASGIILALRSP